MAVTIQRAPENYIRVYDTNTGYYKLHSNLYNQNNFNFIIGIYDDSTLLTTLKLTSDASGNVYYNPCGYLSNYLTSDVDITTDTLVKCNNSIGEYNFLFYEQYGDPIVVYTGSTTSTKVYYNGCQIYENWDFSGGTDYWLLKDSSSNGHLLSPVESWYLDSREKLWIYFIMSGDTVDFSVNYDVYNTSDVLISSITYAVVPTGATMCHLGAGPSNIPGNLTALPNSWSYYYINFQNIANDYIGLDRVIVHRKDKCNKDWTEIYWLNEHGGWSNFSFNKRRYDKSKISRNSFKKFLDYGYSTTSTFTPQRQTTQYKTEIEQYITLNTDWINDTENKLIESLLYSPDVRMKKSINGTDYLIAVNVIDADYEKKNTYDYGLYQYEINIKIDHQKVIQTF